MEYKLNELKLTCKVPHTTSGSIIVVKYVAQYKVRTDTQRQTNTNKTRNTPTNRKVKWYLTVETTDSQSGFKVSIPTAFKCL